MPDQALLQFIIVACDRQTIIKTVVFIEALAVLRNNAPAIASQQRNF
jgi:hypothetical protein